MTHSFQVAIHKTRIMLGQRLLNARERLGFKRSDLARNIGYRNISKGAWRISTWEKGEATPPRQFMDALAQTLRSDEVHELMMGLLEAESQYKGELRMRNRVYRAAQRRLWLCLASHLDVFTSNSFANTASSGWTGAVVPGAHVGMAYIGGKPLTLGSLVSGWRDGYLTEGGTIFSLSGSPLSGCNVIHGVRNGQIDKWHYANGWMKLATPVAQTAGLYTPSDISPLDVLADQGVSIPDIPIYNADGDIHWVWKISCPQQRRSLRKIRGRYTGVGLESYTLPNGCVVHPGYVLGSDQCVRLLSHWPVPPHVAHHALMHTRTTSKCIPLDFLERSRD